MHGAESAPFRGLPCALLRYVDTDSDFRVLDLGREEVDGMLDGWSSFSLQPHFERASDRIFLMAVIIVRLVVRSAREGGLW